MKREPIYQSGKPLVAEQSITWRLLVVTALAIAIALIGSFLGSGLDVQANAEATPAVEQILAVTPATADGARDLADEVRTTVICPDEGAGDAVCQERGPETEVLQIPGTGED
jgi:hypothetical protein